MFLLRKIFILIFTLGICLEPMFIYPLLILIIHRVYSKSQSLSTVAFLEWLLKGENGFSLIYGIWITYYGEYLFEYSPLLLYSLIIWLQLSQQQTPISRDKQLKQDVTLLKNRLEIIILLYEMVACIGNRSMLWRMFIMGFILKTKYGFNTYLQLIFRLAHNSMLSLFSSIYPLLYLYKGLYKIICLFGKVYLQKRVHVKFN